MPGKKRILVLGSGMVAPPCIEYLTRNPQNEVTVACEPFLVHRLSRLNFPERSRVP
ncbi:unnamed protein product [Penicillium nalgiovense]|uniref:Uncharacterized protein n=1 Tax=Penicillium nalgiovense TaxID=60175 RepID=A0A9W4MSA0_PENNA|nr:unnamed protein product [Penicillium nalgiovense]CAG7984318.1 unnamed protein product [Penicillium nalgiovense]CAG8022211.1 unnamed protein product [Penicillium nalgiovense]CAG8022797.1 unnamed protein product [Penicillium nalgiovense]CAG8027466.1 unnamed protein product [Penicillium nalgiovense]